MPRADMVASRTADPVLPQWSFFVAGMAQPTSQASALVFSHSGAFCVHSACLIRCETPGKVLETTYFFFLFLSLHLSFPWLSAARSQSAKHPGQGCVAFVQKCLKIDPPSRKLENRGKIVKSLSLSVSIKYIDLVRHVMLRIPGSAARSLPVARVCHLPSCRPCPRLPLLPETSLTFQRPVFIPE